MKHPCTPTAMAMGKPEPSVSTTALPNTLIYSTSHPMKRSSFSPELIKPLPKTKVDRKPGIKRKTKHCEILTDSTNDIDLLSTIKDSRSKKKIVQPVRRKDDEFCTVCIAEWGSTNEDWLKCISCKKWGCESCFGSEQCLNCITK